MDWLDDFGEVPEFLTKPEILAEMDLNEIQVPDLDLRPDYWIWVQEILENTLKGHEVCAFGSRTKWTNREGSDLDLVVMDEVSFKEICAAEEAFKNSLLPMRVDVGQWLKMTEDFQNRIRKDLVKLTNRDDDIPNGWQKKKIIEIGKVICGKTPPTSNPIFYGRDIPFITIPDMHGKVLITETKKGLSKIGEAYQKNKTLPPFSVCVSCIATPGLVVLTTQPSQTNQQINSIIPKKEISPFFLFYSMKFIGEEIKLQGSGGSVFYNLNTSNFKEIELSIPPLPEQEAIAGVLGSLDDKIQHNKAQNKILEEMAQALFQNWFVHFGPVREKIQAKKENRPEKPYLAPEIWNLFPDSLNDDGIPEGWEEKPLKSFVTNFDSKRIPISSLERKKRQGKFPYYGATHILDFIDNYLFEGTFLLIGEDGSVITETGKPYLQYVYGKFWVSNHAHVLQGENGVSTEQLLLFLSQLDITPYVTGAVQLKLSQGRMNSIPFVYGGKEISEIFNKEITPFFQKIRQNEQENQKLSEMRDTLLPRLISGKVRVNTKL